MIAWKASTPLKKAFKEIARYLIPISIKYETMATCVFIIYSVLIAKLALHYSDLPRNMDTLEHALEESVIPGLIILSVGVTSLAFRALKRKQSGKVFLSVVLYSFISGTVYWGYWVWAVVLDKHFSLPVRIFLKNAALFGLNVVVPAMIWLLLILILAASYKLLK